MSRLLRRLWNDDAGALLATEWVILATILVIALIVGFKSVQQAVVTEFSEFSSAVGSLSTTYSYGGTSGCCAFTSGSFYSDQSSTFDVTTCDDRVDTVVGVCPD